MTIQESESLGRGTVDRWHCKCIDGFCTVRRSIRNSQVLCGAMAEWWRGSTLVLLLVCLVSQSAASTLPRDVDALQGLLRAWQGTPGLLDEWSLDKNADPCGSHWKGVRCCPSMNSVVGLDLSFAGLVGSIPVEIGDLHKLRYLDFSGNQKLTGAIPKEIGNLRLLATLKLSGCDLTGTPPEELGSLSKLKVLDLSDNPSLQDSNSFFESHSRVSSRFVGNGLKFLRHRALLQAVPPAPLVRPPSPAPALPPPPPTPVRTYLLYVGIGAFCLVFTSVAVFCLCRKFGQQKIQGAQRLPPLPRYH